MRLLSVLLVVAVLSLSVVGPAFAMDNGECNHDLATIESLHHCVTHAAEMGHITNHGVANALLSKLNAAQAALDRGQPAVAITILRAFIHTVEAQSGVSIVDPHGEHLIMHAQMVIDALQSN